MDTDDSWGFGNVSDDSSSGGEMRSNPNHEKEVYEQKMANEIRDGIRDGSMVMKNGDGTYTCPLSPERKKQRYTYCELQTHATQYKYRELLGLADATQIGSGKKGHGALEKFLDSKPLVAHLEQAVPSRGAGATRLLAPWMGILVNIDNTRINEEGRRLAAGGADIKEKFQEYNPEKVKVFHDGHGDQGMAVLTFRNDIHGLEDAQAFAHSFATTNRGSKEWRDEKRAYSLDLYGWQATEEDLTANLGQVTAYLKKFCDLKSVRDMVEDLVKKVDQKNDMMAASRHQFVVLHDMIHEVNSLRVKAEEEKRTMEEQHKRDLEAMQLQLQAEIAAHNERLLAQLTALTTKLRALEGRCEAMKEGEVQMRQESEAKRQHFSREKQDAERLLKEAREQAELHAATQDKQLDKQGKQLDEQKRIIKMHEVKVKLLGKAVLGQARKLERLERLERELQKQHVKEMLEIKKLNETDKEKIRELESEQEMLQEMVNALSQKERMANHLLEDARKVAVQVLDTYGVDERIDNKLVGSIEKKLWAAACQKKFMYHPGGWELVMTKMISEWEDRIGNHEYRPYKNVKLDPEGNEWKRIINEDDEFIKKLKEDLGAKVMQTVATAFFEIEDYNASGRYPMWVAWNFETNEQVQLKDLLMFMKELLDEAMKKQVMSKRKRARANE